MTFDRAHGRDEIRTITVTSNVADLNFCATRRFVAFPAQPGGIGGVFLDPMAYPDSKEGRGREHAS
jgi:hypothetical protein